MSFFFGVGIDVGVGVGVGIDAETHDRWYPVGSVAQPGNQKRPFLSSAVSFSSLSPSFFLLL